MASKKMVFFCRDVPMGRLINLPLVFAETPTVSSQQKVNGGPVGATHQTSLITFIAWS